MKKKILGRISDVSLTAIGEELVYAPLIGKIGGGGPLPFFFLQYTK